MEILHNFSNFDGGSLATLQDALSAAQAQLRDVEATLSTAKQNIAKCEERKAGLFSVYNCKGNTGKTLNDWRDLRNSKEREKKALDEQIMSLRQQISAASSAQASTTTALTQQAQMEAEQGKAGLAKAKKIGMYSGIVLASLFVGVIIFKKIRKK